MEKNLFKYFKSFAEMDDFLEYPGYVTIGWQKMKDGRYLLEYYKMH